MNTVKINPAEFGLEADKAQEIESVFLPVIAEKGLKMSLFTVCSPFNLKLPYL